MVVVDLVLLLELQCPLAVLHRPLQGRKGKKGEEALLLVRRAAGVLTAVSCTFISVHCTE